MGHFKWSIYKWSLSTNCCIFKGDNKPTITKTMDLEILKKPSNRSNLGLSVMNGNIFHFDATNKKLGVQSINSKNGSPFAYLCTSTDDDDAAVSVSLTSSALSVGIMAAVVAAIF